MGNKKTGLSSKFSVNVDVGDLAAPIQLGDFLDEDEAQSKRSAFPLEAVRPERSEKTTPSIAVEGQAVSQPINTQPVISTPPTQYQRIQISATDETKRQAKTILDIFEAGDRKITNSDMHRLCTRILYEAREFIDLSNLSKRGQHGSDSARAFQANLVSLCTKAIVTKFSSPR